MVYDPQARHERYMRTRELKGRQPGKGPEPAARKPASAAQISAAQQKVSAISSKLNHLRELLRQKVADSKKADSSSDKTTTADKLKARERSKDYYNEHKNEIKNDRAQASRKSGGSSSSSSSSKTASSMSTDELKTAIRNTVVQLQNAIAEAKRLRGG